MTTDVSTSSPSDLNHKAPQSFAYGRLIVETHLTGLAAMLACHCEPKFYNAEVPLLRLELNEAMSAMRDSPAMATFTIALKDYFGDHLELDIVEGPALKSPAALAAAKKVMGYVVAYDIIMKDDVVLALLKQFDSAKALIETVRPVTPNSRKPS